MPPSFLSSLPEDLTPNIPSDRAPNLSIRDKKRGKEKEREMGRENAPQRTNTEPRGTKEDKQDTKTYKSTGQKHAEANKTKVKLSKTAQRVHVLPHYRIEQSQTKIYPRGS